MSQNGHSLYLHDTVQPMRDGTKLKANVYLPKGEGPFPALVERTPYNKDESMEVQAGATKFFTERGYAVVIQDVRGRFQSEGKFIPFIDDGWGVNRDGYDTIEWIAAQPWCNGQVGTIGGSYSGATQYRLAPTRPPHLRAMYVRESSADYHTEWVYRDGAFELAFMLEWTILLALNNLSNLTSGEEYKRRKGTLEMAIREIDSWRRHLPLNPNPLVAGLNDWYNDYLSHPDDGPYWWNLNIALHHHEIETPICHLGGWHDIFLNGTLKNYMGLRARARTPEARNAQHLVIGPWIHGPLNLATSIHGEIDFGSEAIRDYNEIRLPWFEYWLKGIENGITEEPRIKLFVMGENRWQVADEYPVPGTQFTSWYLHENGHLNRTAPTEAEQPDSYLYDPNDPVPTLGGCTLYVDGGAFDQRPIEHRCLIYTSEPLTQDLTIIGPVKCILHAMSSAPDTDWVVRLTDVHPDGTSRFLCDGLLRACYRNSKIKPSPLAPNQIYEFEVDLWATANTFMAGHRIRVAITSSCFPRFDRNLNTGGVFGQEAQGQPAYNTIFHDGIRPSSITLPMVEGYG